MLLLNPGIIQQVCRKENRFLCGLVQNLALSPACGCCVQLKYCKVLFTQKISGDKMFEDILWTFQDIRYINWISAFVTITIISADVLMSYKQADCSSFVSGSTLENSIWEYALEYVLTRTFAFAFKGDWSDNDLLMCTGASFKLKHFQKLIIKYLMVERAAATELVSYISHCLGPKSVWRAACHVTAHHIRQHLWFSENLQSLKNSVFHCQYYLLWLVHGWVNNRLILMTFFSMCLISYFLGSFTHVVYGAVAQGLAPGPAFSAEWTNFLAQNSSK